MINLCYDQGYEWKKFFNGWLKERAESYKKTLTFERFRK